ncbi:MAG: alpha/beta hydrolase [Pseudomonadota bacterium]
MRALILIALFALSACSGPQLLNVATPSLAGTWERTEDIAYGTLPRQKLDLYTPTTPGPHPLLIFVHGGSWEKGRKEDYPWLGRRFASEGYLTAVINYRLAPEHTYRDFMADVAKAVAFLHAEAPAFDGDPDQLFLIGHSAGAYNAVQVALAPEFLEAEGRSTSIIDGVVGLAGPYSFLPLDSRVTKAAFGAAPDLEATQPINRVTANAPPMLFVHGTDDDVVSPKNATEMARLLTEVGVRGESILYTDTDHIEIIVAIGLTSRGSVLADSLAFLKSVETEPAETNSTQ